MKYIQKKVYFSCIYKKKSVTFALEIQIKKTNFN